MNETENQPVDEEEANADRGFDTTFLIGLVEYRIALGCPPDRVGSWMKLIATQDQCRVKHEMESNRRINRGHAVRTPHDHIDPKHMLYWIKQQALQDSPIAASDRCITLFRQAEREVARRAEIAAKDKEKQEITNKLLSSIRQEQLRRADLAYGLLDEFLQKPGDDELLSRTAAAFHDARIPIAGIETAIKRRLGG